MSAAVDPPSLDRSDWASAPSLTDFCSNIAPLTGDERTRIITAATKLLSGYYVHLPFKRDAHGVDPLAELNLLSAALPGPTEDIAFQKAMCEIFAGLRDLHTQYSLPQPYQSSAAILPFKLGAYVRGDETRYLVTDLLGMFAIPPEHLSFKVGTEILTWCGMSMKTAVARLAAHSAGASDAARHSRALAAMTLRPMERQAPPDEEFVTLTYRGPDGASVAGLSIPWRVIDVSIETADPSLARFVGIDHEGEVRRRASARLYHPKVLEAERRASSDGGRHKPYPATAALGSTLPSVFKAHRLSGTDYGYIRIFTFNPPIFGASIEVLLQVFRDEFRHLIGELPQSGLIIDVRGNGGGCMPLAETLLQTFTDEPIVPQSLELRATPEILALARASADLNDFVPSLEQLLPSGYSAGFPLTKPEWCNGAGRQYSGPVVLIIDALCYSATDAFAAGFQDHRIGPIIGVSPTTGAGGANVWTLSEIEDALGAGSPQGLPRGANLRVAVRRTRRVGPNSGALVEEFGVRPEILHHTTHTDLLHGDRDLLALAARTLSQQP